MVILLGERVHNVGLQRTHTVPRRHLAPELGRTLLGSAAEATDVRSSEQAKQPDQTPPTRFALRYHGAFLENPYPRIERVDFIIPRAAASRNFSSSPFRHNTTSEFSNAVDNGTRDEIELRSHLWHVCT